MKIVHLVTFNQGGAYRAAERISKALSIHMESSVITCADVQMGRMAKIMQKIRHKLYTIVPFKVRTLDYYYNTDIESIAILKMQQIKSADIIHLHWVADGMLSLKDLKCVAQTGKPIVWTLHDMHPFTGGCHYNDNCEKYKDKCGACKQINSVRERDFASWNQNRKIEALQNANMTVVGCSRWIAQCANESAVMKNMNCISIPNCIETDIYKPCDRNWARQRLNIAVGAKKVIAFGAMNSTSDKRKGFVYLKKALEMLDKDKYACLILGGGGERIDDMQTFTINYLNDDYSLALFYAAADVFVAPSIQENLANTVMESLSSGTPVVAFEIGGMPDMVVKEYNGYLARPFDVDDLAKGIEYCCQNEEMGKNARMYVLDHYQFETVAEKYTDIYNALLKRPGAGNNET